MCGDLEDEGTRHEDDLYQRFLVHSRGAAARVPAGGDGLNAYLDRLFADLLQRCVADSHAGDAPDGYRRMAMQSLVLGRLAGYLAGHVALNEDPMRKVMEATLLGYAEADAPAPGHDRDHGHDHDHDHDHGHSHDGNH